jgi:tetratricopeptide (TPR) repeat protein
VRWPSQVFWSGVRPAFGAWLLGAVLISVIMVSAPAAAGQSALDALLGQARVAEKAGDYTGAARIYQQALSVAPGNLEVLKRVGVLEQTELKFDDSIAHFQQVLTREPQFSDVNFFLGVSYFGKNDFQRAIQSFERELATPKPHPRCRYYLALALQSSGRVDDAISQLTQSLDENPTDADALYQLARIHKSASLQAIDRLKNLDPDSFQLHALMGEIYAEEEHYAEAAKEYRSALDKRPGAQGIHYSIGVAYWAQHHLDGAEKEFTLALKESSDDPMANLYLGDIAVQEARFAEALAYLRVAQKGQLNLPQIHLLLGKCYRAQNDLESAKTEFVAAIKVDPTAASPHYLLAQVYRAQHNAEASARELAEYENLSRLNPDKKQEAGGGESIQDPK